MDSLKPNGAWSIESPAPIVVTTAMRGDAILRTRR